MMGDTQETVEIINRFVQSVCHLGMDLAKEIEREQGCEPGSSFEFVNPKICSDLSASNYYEQKIQFCRANIHINSTNADDFQLRKRISHFVASKADLIYKLKGKERLRCGVDYDADGSHEAYSLFATQVPPLEFGMKVSPCARRAQMFQILKVGDVIIGEVVGKRPFGVFVRVAGLIHGRNLDFSDIDIQALCHKSELEKDHKSREHLDPIDDFQINDIVRGVICSVSVEEERIAISFRSSKIPSEYGNIELGIVEDTDEHTRRTQSFDEDREYIEYLEEEPGFANPRNVQTLLNVLGIDSKPPSSLLRSCQRWSFDSQGDATNLRKQQSMKWSMDTTAVGVENFKSGCHEKAMKCFNHALQIYEENAEALVARGALYANQNQLENAIKDFREALNVHPNHHNASKYLKETLFEKAIRIKNTGNVKEAIEVFQEVLDFDPTNAECLAHLRELQAVMSAKDDSSKKGKASVGSAKESHQFEHVRKLIEADQELVRSSRKKKRKKKKRRKGLTRKKRAHYKDLSEESTSTASEQEHSSDNEWVEKKLDEKLSPKRHGGNHETLPKAKGGIACNRLKSSDSNNLAGEKHPLFSAELTGFEGRRKSEESGGLALRSNSGVSNSTRMELKNEREVAPRRGSIKALGGRDSGSIVNVVHKGAKDFRWEIQGGLKKQGRESRSRSVESAGGRGGSRRKSRDSSESGENEKCRNRKSENRSRSNSRGSRDAREKNVGNPRPRDGSVKVRKEKSEMMIRSSTRISISSRSRSRSRSRGKRNESRSSTRSRSYGRSRSSSGSEDISCKGNKERTTRRNKHRSRSRVRSQKRGRVRNTSSSVSSKDRSLTRSKSRGGSSERSSCKNRRRSQHEVRFRSRSQRRGLQRRQGRNRSRERSRSASLRRIRRRKRSRSYDRSLKRSEKRTTWRRSRSRNESFTGASSESSDGSKKSSEKKYQRKR